MTNKLPPHLQKLLEDIKKDPKRQAILNDLCVKHTKNNYTVEEIDCSEIFKENQ